MANRDRALLQIALTYAKRDLLGLTQPREEPKLVEVAHGLAPLGMDSENECLRFLNGEGVYWGAILFHDPKAIQSCGWIGQFRMIFEAELKRTAQRAYTVVICLF